MGIRGRGSGTGRGRGTVTPSSSRVARSGIRTRGGNYKKFDSQRVREVEQRSEETEEQSPALESTDSGDDDTISGDEPPLPSAHSYATLLRAFRSGASDSGSRPTKRRRLDAGFGAGIVVNEDDGAAESVSSLGPSEAGELLTDSDDKAMNSNSDVRSVSSDEPEADANPYEAHFVEVAGADLGATGAAKAFIAAHSQYKVMLPKCSVNGSLALANAAVVNTLSSTNAVNKLPLKPRLKASLTKEGSIHHEPDQTYAPYVLSYTDLLVTNRAPQNAPSIRRLLGLHAVNHILAGRDRILKNNARLAQADDDELLELRDQGFTRPKVLILTETRQMCAKYAECIVDLFQPEQQENRQRFQDSFSSEALVSNDMPEDYRELFEGNNDNSFITTIKFTRKTIKYFSAFYQSDIILASPLGLRRIIEHEDKKKQDSDFLSSIEIMVLDQADAMQMQNWENVELVFQHLNLTPKELRDCDVNRVRNWYLDGQAKHLRQTIMLSAYLTPETNRTFNRDLQNVSGKVKVTQTYPGTIQAAAGLDIKQVFSRFPSASPLDDPDARFKFFTTSVLPSLLRIPQASQGGQGILIFIPSYFDFLRMRNFFATSTMTEHVSFGAIHDYSDVSEQRRARSHFLSGKHSLLLYTQRAHHFYRLRLRGVKRIVMYGLPDNHIFYQELIAGYLGSSVETGTGAGECSVRSMFSKFDALSMERIVGTDRVKGMLAGNGDTFEFMTEQAEVDK